MKSTPDKQTVSSFGFSVSLGLSILGTLLILRGQMIGKYVIGACVLIALLTIFIPAILRPVKSVAMICGRLANALFTRAILGIVFFCFFTPLTVLLRLMGRQFLDVSQNEFQSSYWHKRDRRTNSDPTKQFTATATDTRGVKIKSPSLASDNHGRMKRSIPTYRKLLYMFVPLILLVLTAELGLRAVYYNYANPGQYALTLAFSEIRRRVLIALASNAAEQYPSKNIAAALYSSAGLPMLTALEQEYQNNFGQLVAAAKTVNAKVVMMYIPTPGQDAPTAATNRSFFHNTTKLLGTDFIDLTDKLSTLPERAVFLLPENEHPSRYGNQVIAAQLVQYLDNQQSYRSRFTFNDHPPLLGDLRTNDRSIWTIVPAMPYQVITNKQGLRMTHDVMFPKTKQRILMLGDSFTFGPYVSNQDTISANIERLRPELEVINAGVSGYTITDETALFVERAKYTEPDIVVLQVLDNDISGLLYFKKNQLNRQRRAYMPSQLEKDFMEKFGKINHTN